MKKIIIILIGFLISVQLFSVDKYRNSTNYDVDKVIDVGTKVLGIDDVNIHVRYIDGLSWLNLNYTLYGSVIQHDINNYTILIKSGLKNYEEIVVHELIHIHQFKTSRLIKINNDTFIYDNDTICISEVSYKHREFEKDAHYLDHKLLKTIKYLIDNE